MSNIRFVKPPNDNRMRTYPAPMMINDVISMASTKNDIGIFAPKLNNTLHITTPKRSIINNAVSDISINKINSEQPQVLNLTSNNDKRQKSGKNNYNDNIKSTNDNIHRYSSFSDDSKQSIFQEFIVSKNSVPNTVLDSVLSSRSEINHNSNISMTTMTPIDNQIFEGNKHHQNSQSIRETSQTEENSEIESKVDESYEKVHKSKYEEKADQELMSVESPMVEDDAECLIESCSKSIDCSSELDISDVLNEELDQLPEVGQPGSVICVNQKNYARRHQKEKISNQVALPQNQQKQQNDNQRTKPQRKKQKTTNKESQSMGELEQKKSKKQEHKILNSTEVKQESQLTSLSSGGQNEISQAQISIDNNYNKHTSPGRPIHRSISEAGLVDTGRTQSFFSSINDAKFYGLNRNEPLAIEEMICVDEKDGSTTKLSDHQKMIQQAKIAWSSDINNQKFEKSLETVTSKETTSLPKFGDGHVLIARSLSRDSALSDRLKIRRCALADPENMIMRQDVREKIQKEVEKRRTSMVRKISQFFNVRLNLNKEEDLI